jgi:uncharacterized membrane protein YkoI
MYWVVALVAVLALAAATITLTSRLTSAGGDATPAAACDAQDEADDAAEAAEGPDSDAIEDECGPQDEGDDVNETHAGPGQLDDGANLLPQAAISVDEAIAAAQSAASGALGEVDLEDYQGTLVFNVDIGDKDVKVDASNGSVLAADLDD